MNKEKTIIGLSLKGESIYMYLDTELPAEDKIDNWLSIMEQFDIPENDAKEIVNKFKQLALDIERIVGL